MKSILFNFHDVVLIITIYQCLLFSIFLVTFKKGKKQSNVLLAMFLLCFAALPLDILIKYGDAFRPFAIEFSPNMFNIFGSAYWLEGPLLLFYVRAMVYEDYKFKLIDLIYLTPFFVFVLDYLINWVMLEYQTKIAILNGYHISEKPFWKRLIDLSREIFRTYFTVICLLELQKYHKQIQNQFASIENYDLTWLKFMVIGFLILNIDAIIISLAIISSEEYNLGIDYEAIGLFSNYGVLLFISAMIFFSLSHSSLFGGIRVDEVKPSEEPQEPPIDPAQVKKITDAMDTEKPYLNHLLRLESLANQLGIPPRQLSNIINRHFNKSFFEFINTYRIEESKKLLVSEENRTTTMLDVMDLAGFNSKATFNTLFKKTVGVTPTQYRKEMLAQAAIASQNKA